MKFLLKIVSVVAMFFMATSCFTGIENTKKITTKDVAKVEQERGRTITTESQYNAVKLDSFPNWNKGKLFYVVDDNVRLIFAPSTLYDVDTLHLSGRTLEYNGYTESSILDNEPKVNLHFRDGVNEYIYPTKKTINEIQRLGVMLQVPFMIEQELVSRYNTLLSGKTFYLKTSIWYDERGNMITGKKFIPVTIKNISPGDKVFPLRVSFVTKDEQTAYLFMSTKQSSVQNRLFDNLFSETDIRTNYPTISDANWAHIVNGSVAPEMTKDECRLSLGSPNSIQERPTYDGLQEYWFYSDGMYLVFFDGLLKQFRK